MQNDVNANQSEQVAIQTGIQGGGYMDIVAKTWSAPSNTDRGEVPVVPDGFPSLSLHEGEANVVAGTNSLSNSVTDGGTLPKAKKDNASGANAINAETAPDTPSKKSLEAFAAEKLKSKANKVEDGSNELLPSLDKEQMVKQFHERLMKQLQRPLEPDSRSIQPIRPLPNHRRPYPV